MGVISQDNQLNKEKAVNMYQIEDEEMVDDCDKEMGKCHTAFKNITKLIMIPIFQYQHQYQIRVVRHTISSVV